VEVPLRRAFRRAAQGQGDAGRREPAVVGVIALGLEYLLGEDVVATDARERGYTGDS
jgi:hypothetical protein